jgi:hypothetical protein
MPTIGPDKVAPNRLCRIYHDRPTPRARHDPKRASWQHGPQTTMLCCDWVRTNWSCFGLAYFACLGWSGISES